MRALEMVYLITLTDRPQNLHRLLLHSLSFIQQREENMRENTKKNTNVLFIQLGHVFVDIRLLKM